MPSVNPESLTGNSLSVHSRLLERTVSVDFYPPPFRLTGPCAVLLINDGQDLQRMGFEALLRHLYHDELLQPLLCVGIHAGPHRKLEYGTAHAPDYRNRGSLAPRYTDFIIQELMPVIRKFFPDPEFTEWAFAGFSLGGLSALDITWSNPLLFKTAGVFSGSLWWRSLDQQDPRYRDELHRLMHGRIQAGVHQSGLRFFFECGTKDETEDRNHNGIIDSIDDTMDLIAELTRKGYSAGRDICYLEIPGGTHDPATWARAMPEFLTWAWGRNNHQKL